MYLVVGGSGFLGMYLIHSILEKTSDNIIATGRTIEGTYVHPRLKWVQCDVENGTQVDALMSEIAGTSPLNVIFLAAYHHPDKVEQNPKLGWSINIIALAQFLNKLPPVRSFFYPSSDSVYGESIDGYHFKESDPLSPVNRYGKQKVAAETLVTSYGHHVVRYPFLVGSSLCSGKKHFYDHIVESLTAGKPVEMFTDSVRSALHFRTAAELLLSAMALPPESVPPVLNLSGDEDLSKYEVGCRIADFIGAPRHLILGVVAKPVAGQFQVKRAGTSLMDNMLMKKVLVIKSISLEF